MPTNSSVHSRTVPSPHLRHALSQVEPFFQHRAFDLTFLLVFFSLQVILFFVGAAPTWRDLLHETSVMRCATALARGSATLIDFNASLVIVLASRSFITFLRSTAFNVIIPFDKAMPAFHSFVGNTIIAASSVHTLAHIVRYTTRNLRGPGLFGPTSLLISGILLVLILILIRVTSLLRVRRKSFETFYLCHQFCFLVFYTLILLHGSHNGVLKTWMYVLVPLVIYTFDRSLRLKCERRCRLSISSNSVVSNSPDMICLRIPRPFLFLAGQYCDISVPQISHYQWHPFTIASSPHESHMLFYIKVNGDWTRHLYNLLNRSHDLPSQKNFIIHVRGPYGAPAQHVGQFEHIVLISGGVGATPFCSIAKYCHHWILNFTSHGETAANSVSGAYARNQSLHSTPNKLLNTPINQSARLSSWSRRSRNRSSVSRRSSRSTSRNISGGDSLKMRSVSRSPRVSNPSSHPDSNEDFDRSKSFISNDSTDLNFQSTLRSPRTEPESPITPRARLSRASFISSPAVPLLDKDFEPFSPAVRPGFSREKPPPYRLEINAPEPVAKQKDVFVPDDYIEELGNPDLPIPSRRSMVHSSSKELGLHAPAFDADDYDCGQEKFDEDEEYVEEEEIVITSKGSGVIEALMEEGLTLDSAGLEALENDILREGTVSNNLNMLGITIGPSAMIRHMQAMERRQKQDAIVRTAVNLMEDATDAVVWYDKILFYMNTVSLNWILFWVMLLKYVLLFVGMPTHFFWWSQKGFGVFDSLAFNIIDLLASIVLLLPMLFATVMEMYISRADMFIAEHVGNSVDAFIGMPMLVTSVVFHVINLCGVGRDVRHISKVTVLLFWPVVGILVTWRVVRTIGDRVMLAVTRRSAPAKTKSVDFLWVSKTVEDDRWLIEEMLPLAESGVVRLHRFITRHGPRLEGWMLNYEKLPIRTTYGRPQWEDVFIGLVERSRSGTKVGVFFCGPDSMAAMVKEAAMKAMTRSVENAYERGYFTRLSGSDTENESRVVEEMVTEDGVMNESSSMGGGIGDDNQVEDACAFGCSVQICVKVENFT